MKRRSTILAACSAFALVGWIAAGSYLFATNCCPESSPVVNGVVQNSLLSVKDGTRFQVSANSAVQFAINSPKAVLSEEIMDKLFELSRYIKSNPLRKLILVGYYGVDETTNEQLGLNRALDVKKIFLKAGVPEYQLGINTKSKRHLQRNQEFLMGMVDFNFEALDPIVVRDDLHDFERVLDGNLAFKKSSLNLLMPLAPSAKSIFSDIASYLKNRRSRKLIIKGYYHPNEVNDSGLPNLGIGRANKIKMLLTSLSVPDQQIEIQSIQKADLSVINSTLYGIFTLGSIDLSFEEVTKTYLDSLEAKRRSLEAIFREKKIYRFKDFGAEEMKVVRSEALRAYLLDVINYININPRAAIYCVGHSNYTKDRDFNYNRGYERAEYIKKFLSKHGVHPDRIVVKSVGAKHPLGTDKTLYGQYINRRVDLVISFDGTTPKLSVLPKINPQRIEKTKKTSKLKENKTNDVAVDSSDKKEAITTPKKNTTSEPVDMPEEKVSVQKDSI